jgi:hypothetical protein
MKIRTLPYLILFLACLLLSTSLFATETTDSLETAFIKVHHRRAQEILPQIRSLLSARGRASADNGTNSLIVIDTPTQVRQVKDLAVRLDRPTPQVTVLLRMRGETDNGRLLSTDGGIRGATPGLTMATGRMKQNQTLRITLSSGTRGSLTIGRQVPITSAWLDLCARHGFRVGWLTEYKTFATRLSVRPVVLDHAVELTLTPMLSFDRGHSLVFAGAATTELVTPDTWTEIGAAAGGEDVLSAVILSGQAGHRSGSMIMEVKALIHEPYH